MLSNKNDTTLYVTCYLTKLNNLMIKPYMYDAILQKWQKWQNHTCKMLSYKYDTTFNTCNILYMNDTILQKWYNHTGKMLSYKYDTNLNLISNILWNLKKIVRYNLTCASL